MSFREPFSLEGKDTVVTVSVGVALAPEDGLATRPLLKSADIALYEAKSAGRNCVVTAPDPVP
jgi:diguanylate cyclase (GGDEF)-like protein